MLLAFVAAIGVLVFSLLLAFLRTLRGPVLNTSFTGVPVRRISGRPDFAATLKEKITSSGVTGLPSLHFALGFNLYSTQLRSLG